MFLTIRKQFQYISIKIYSKERIYLNRHFVQYISIITGCIVLIQSGFSQIYLLKTFLVALGFELRVSTCLQVLYHESCHHFPSLRLFFYTFIIFQIWFHVFASDLDSPIYASHIAGIIGTYQHI
jgi:hypothetical protein